MCNLLVHYKITQKSTPGEIPGFSSTRGIANKGFRGMRRFVNRFNFSCNMTENRPQSLTGHTATVMQNYSTSIITAKWLVNRNINRLTG